MSNMELESVKKLIASQVKHGKIMPLSFAFPSFTVDETIFNINVLNVANERVRFGIDSGQYKAQDMMPGVSYDDLVEAQNAKASGVATPLQLGMMTYCENILPKKMIDDVSLQPRQLLQKATNESINNSLMNHLFEIDQLAMHCVPFGENRSEFQVKRDKFVATLIVMKDKVPAIYKESIQTLFINTSKDLRETILELEKNPDHTVVKHLKDFDEKFAMENFPKQCKDLLKHERFDPKVMKAF